MKDNQKINIPNLQGTPNKLIWFDEAKVSAIIDAVKSFIERKSHYLVVRRAMTSAVADYLTREYCKKIDSYKDVIKRSYIKSNGAVYAILRCIGSCVSDSLEHQDKILRVGEALAVFDANIDAVLSGSERIMDYSQISETRRKEEQVSQSVSSKKTVNFAEALESGDVLDIEKAIAESVKQKELLEKTREEAQKNQQALDIAQTNLENAQNQTPEASQTAQSYAEPNYAQSQQMAQNYNQNATNIQEYVTPQAEPQAYAEQTGVAPQQQAQPQVQPQEYVTPQVEPQAYVEQAGVAPQQQVQPQEYVTPQAEPQAYAEPVGVAPQQQAQQQVQPQEYVTPTVEPQVYAEQAGVAPQQQAQPQVQPQTSVEQSTTNGETAPPSGTN